MPSLSKTFSEWIYLRGNIMQDEKMDNSLKMVIHFQIHKTSTKCAKVNFTCRLCDKKFVLAMSYKVKFRAGPRSLWRWDWEWEWDDVDVFFCRYTCSGNTMNQPKWYRHSFATIVAMNWPTTEPYLNTSSFIWTVQHLNVSSVTIKAWKKLISDTTCAAM